MKPKFAVGDKVLVKNTKYCDNELWKVITCIDQNNGYIYMLDNNGINLYAVENDLSLWEKSTMKPYRNTTNELAAKFAKELVMFLDDMNNELYKAGGAPWSLEELEKVTAAEFLMTLAPNSIRLKYIRKE